MKSSVPAVVVGGGLNALGVVRSLARLRVPVYLVVTTRWYPAAWSRFCRLVLIPSMEGHRLVDGLRELAARIGERPVLFLTSDKDVETVSAFREELEPHFRLGLPSKEMVRRLADKTLFQEFAEKEGFPMPRAVILSGSADLPLLKDLKTPLVIKPCHKNSVLDSKAESVVRVDTLERAGTLVPSIFARMVPGGRIVAQEWVDGVDSDVYFSLFTCDSNSRTTALFSGRKLACYPPEVGSTAVCVAARERSEELAKISLEFIARTGYQGLGGLEFKRDRNSGKFMIIEPTVGRTDQQEEIATLCGVNIPLIAYWTALGHSSETTSEEPKEIAWRFSLRHRAPGGTLPPGIRIVDGHFRMADPLPGLYHYGIEEFVPGIRRLARKLFSWSGQTSTPGKQHSAVRK